MKYNRKGGVWLFVFFLSSGLMAQIPDDSKLNQKLSPKLSHDIRTEKKEKGLFFLQVHDLLAFREYLNQEKIPIQSIRKEFPRWNGVLIELSYDFLKEKVLPNDLVTFIDIRDRRPMEERAVRDLDLSLNKISTVHQIYPSLHGKSLAVSIKENSFDTTDIDFKGRYLDSSLRDRLVSTHASNMATMVAGGGNSFYTGKGVAWQAKLSPSSFLHFFPDEDAYFETDEISVQNHSYGLDIENYYGGEAMTYDEQVFRMPSLIHVFSAGNSGDSISRSGPYQEIPGFANLTGNMKMAKNLLTVGSLDTALSVPPQSSRGPAFDGRVKPELVAFGEDGSSGAAAITSGTALLLQQVYKEQTGHLPPAGLVRAVLINSADDLGPQGPDYVSGYGSLDALGAVRTLRDKRFFSGTLEEGEEQFFTLDLPENATNLKVTLAWIDPPASLNTGKALINDLDLEIESVSGEGSWLPWCLNPFPHPDSLNLAAVRKMDRLNNQEQITVAQPAEGSIEIMVSGHKIPQGPQSYFVAYEWDTIGHFEWTFPKADDPVRGDAKVPLRWESSLEGPGELAYRIVGDSTWKIIQPAVSIGASFYSWEVPDTFSRVQLSMTTTEAVFLSDTFTISQPLKLSLDFDCEDRLLLSWNRYDNARRYQLYGMGEKYLEGLLVTTDTFAVLEKAAFSGDHFTIAPTLIDGKEGMKSPTINLAFQSAGCYIRSFFANLIDDRAELTLNLGSLFELGQVFFEKQIGAQFKEISSIIPAGKLEFRAEDLNLSEGINRYRAVVKLLDGTLIYSDIDSVLYISQPYLVFPNPTNTELGATIFSKTIDDETEFVLFDSAGRIHLKFPLANNYEEIPVITLAAGMYHYQIQSGGTKLAHGKLLIQ